MKSSFKTFAVATFFALLAVSCKKDIRYITNEVPGPLIPVGLVKNSNYWDGPVRPGENHTFAVFNAFNQSNDSVIISSIEVTIKTAQGNKLRELSVYTDGASSYLSNPRSVTNVSLGVVILPRSSQQIDISLRPDIRDTGTVQVIVKAVISRGAIKDTLGPIEGSIISLQLPTLDGVTTNNWSAQSQFIATHNSAVDALQLSYGFQTTGGGLQISALKFAAVGTNTASSIRINGISIPFVNGVASFSNLDFWSWGGFDAYVSYPSVGVNGLPSGTNSQIILTAVTYSNGLESKTVHPNLASNTMKLVASKPTIGVLQPDVVLQNGMVHAIDVTVTADPQGDIILNSLPIQSIGSMFGSVVFGSGTAIVVRNDNNQIVNTISTAFNTSGISKIIFSDAGGYRVAAGTTAKFKVFVPITYADIEATIQTSIVASDEFVWTDIASGSPALYQGTLFMYNYPDYFSSRVHN